MSAMVVCGKRSYFEDLPTSPHVSKRLRCSSSSSSSSSSTSPIRLSPPRISTLSSSFLDCNNNVTTVDVATAAINHLSGLFPNIDKELIGRTLEECGNDMDATTKSLNEICLRLAVGNTDSIEDNGAQPSHGTDTDIGITTTSGETLYSENPSAPDNHSKTGQEWVELFVSEMMNASNMDDARARASRVLGDLEKSIHANATAEATTNFQLENTVLKEQMEVLVRENTILKRAVAIQHKQQKHYDDRNQEFQQLKQSVSQYQEQLRTLQVNNYALTMHLRQAQQSNSIPGRFHPDVF